MGDILRLGLILMAVALVAALSLGYVNAMTQPMIELQLELEKQAAMTEVSRNLAEEGEGLVFDSLRVPGLANPYAGVDHALEVVAVSDSFGTPLGYAFLAYGKGYSSTIQTMVGVDLNGRIAGTTILFQQETPGLGAKAGNEDWIGQFGGHGASDCMIERDGGRIDAITGATITSRAVAGSVSSGLEAMGRAGLFEHREGGDL